MNDQQFQQTRELDGDEIELVSKQAAERTALDLRHANDRFALQSKHAAEQRSLAAAKETAKNAPKGSGHK